MELVSEPAVLTAVARAGPRDRRVTFLTRGRGPVSLYLRRPARHQHERTFLEPLQGGELTYQLTGANNPGRRFTYVPQRVWPGIRGDFDRTVQALAFLELVNLCATEGDPQNGLFTLLVRFLDRLEREKRPEVARAIATLQLLASEGFAPQLGFCVACGAAVEPGRPVAVAIEAGGAVCAACGPGCGERTMVLTPGAHQFMHRALSLAREGAGRLRANPGTTAAVLGFLNLFVTARFGVRPRSIDFLAKLSRAAARDSPG